MVSHFNSGKPLSRIPGDEGSVCDSKGKFGSLVSIFVSRDLRLAQVILKRIALGDRSAVEDCLQAYGGLVWSLARRILRNNEDAEDAVQEIFLDIWKNAGRFDEEQSSETTFIAMIARRRLIDRLRHMGRRISPDSLEDVGVEPWIRSDRTMQVSVEASDAVRAIDELHPAQKRVLYLSIVQGLSHQEIADHMGLPLGTVKSHARRGMLQTREMLGLSESGSYKEVSI
jgi:RNA polymerase sigma factor (sigma-70 family)